MRTETNAGSAALVVPKRRPGWQPWCWSRLLKSIGILAVSLVAVSCRDSKTTGTAKAPAPNGSGSVEALAAQAGPQPQHTNTGEHGPEHENENEREREHEHEHEHGANGKGPSDLDRSPDELFSATCEHGIKTFECNECRYEVGVVRVASDLVRDGLVRTAKVVRQKLPMALELTGEVGFDDTRVTHVSPRAEGVVGKVFVTLGQSVTAGQALLTVESVPLASATSEYLEAQAVQRITRKAFERQRELRAENITSEREYLEAQKDLEAATIRTNTAAATLDRLGLTPSELESLERGEKTSRATMTLRAPASGTVLVMHAVAGENLKREETIISIGEINTVWVWADLYESDLAEVAEHQREGRLDAIIQVRAFPRQQFPGHVDFIGPTMNEATRTAKVRISVENREGKLRPGMFAKVRLMLPTGAETITVPSDAVLEDEGRSFVFIHHHHDYYVRRAVSTGHAWNSAVEIREGLVGNETVVANGSFLLKSDVLRSKMGAGCAD